MKLAKIAMVLTCGLIFCLSGCGVSMDTVEFLNPEGLPDSNETYDGYHSLVLNQSTSADALAAIYIPDYELLSQSKNVIASLGQKKKKGFKTWFKMVAFDELSQTVQRKYLFIDDERPKYLFTSTWETAVFDCLMVIQPEVLDKPYSNNNAKRFAVLESVLVNFRKDIADVKRDNIELATRGMMVNQALETVLVKLRQSPAMAQRLSDEDGLPFSHISMDKAQIKMTISDDGVVSVKMLMGSILKRKVNLEKVVNSFSGLKPQ